MKGLLLFRRAAIVLACVLGMTAAASNPAFAGGQTAYELTGRVSNQSGSPLEGSLVEVFSAGTTTLVATAPTGADGKYAIALFAGTYDVRVTPPASSGFGIATAPNRVISADSALDFVLVPAGSVALSGRVLDAQGAPLETQYVYLAPVGGSEMGPIVTGSDGSYAFAVAPGNYVLSIAGNPSPPSAAPTNYHMHLSQGLTLTESRVLDLRLPLKRVDVHVQDPNGQPVSNATLNTNGQHSEITIDGVSGYGYSNYYTYSGYASVRTDASGNATLWLFPSMSWNTYTITATPPTGVSLAATSVQQQVSGDAALTITLAAPVTLSGRVLDALGTPLETQYVYLGAVGGAEMGPIITGSDGSYAFAVAPGNYVLSIAGNPSPPSAAPTNYHMHLSQGLTLTESRVLDLRLPLKRVDVHVQDLAGQPVPNVTLNTNGQHSEITIDGVSGYGYSNYYTYSGYASVRTDASGNATLWLFPSMSWNSYTITATPPPDSAFAAFSVQNVTVVDHKELFVVLQFAHEPPVTTIAVSPQDLNGVYPDPVIVTLSALAAQGYTVQSTQYSLDGGAAQTYAGPFTVSGGGQHTIQYWSVDNTGVFELPKTLTIQIAQAGGKATGGGTVENNGVRANFGFTATSGEPGSLTYVEHRKGATVQLKAVEIYSVAINGNSAVITGSAMLNGSSGYSFRVTAVDNGEPGRDDRFGLEVRDADGAIVPGLTFAPVTLSGGNIQVHK